MELLGHSGHQVGTAAAYTGILCFLGHFHSGSYHRASHTLSPVDLVSVHVCSSWAYATLLEPAGDRAA